VDVRERLSLEAVSAHTAIAAEHVHRYELAAELCRGLRVADVCCGTGYGCRILRERSSAVTGVDNDVATVDTAQATVGRDGDVSFEVGEAVEFLRGDLAERFDALVLFEGLEHLPDPGAALAELRRHAERGMKLILSLRGDEGLGYDEATAAFSGFADVEVLYQFLAEGSLIRSREPEETGGRFVLAEHGEPEYANQFIACVNFGGAAGRAASARTHLTVAPAYNRHLRNLERSNRELRQANARLARARVGTSSSAAASLLRTVEVELEQHRAEVREAREAAQRAEERARQAEEQAKYDAFLRDLAERVREDIYASLSWRMTAPLRTAKRLVLRRKPGERE
jgi:SAM-dependent methyltransferase